METILKAYGLWKVIDETNGKKETSGKQKTTIDEKAKNTTKGIIFQTLPQDMLMQVAQYTTTKEVWNSIKVKHIGADLVQKARLEILISELKTLKMKPNESANEFAGKLSSIQAKFKSQDELESNYQNKLLLASSNNQGGGRGHGRNFTKNKNSYGKGTSRGSIDKSKLRCYECGEHGHFVKECTKWKDKKKDKEQKGQYPRQKILFSWCAPTHGPLKFNVDGSAMVGILESNVAEVIAIKKACSVIKEKEELRSVNITIESNSLNAVSWFNHPDERPWRLLHHFHDIDAFLVISPNRLVMHIKRERNNDADKLAKEGVSRSVPLVVWQMV
nr:zinc finger, CCHC-type [Tanacetum cinerariifolium]